MVDPKQIPFLDGISVAALGEDRFAGVYPHWWEGDRVFGGLVLGQAVAAACATVDPWIPLHSIHAYFLRPARPGDESELVVDRLRDGRSFSNRRTTTRIQGRQSFEMLSSFHVPESGEEYQLAMPTAPSPGTEGEVELDGPFECWELGASPQREDGTYESTRRAWIRCKEPLGEDPRRHAAAAAYASDMTRAAFRPYSLGTWGEHVDASLDHAVWFHRPPVMDEWHLFDLHALVTGGGRSFMRGTMHDERGRLVLSMAQEILIRRLDDGVPVTFEDAPSP